MNNGIVKQMVKKITSMPFAAGLVARRMTACDGVGWAGRDLSDGVGFCMAGSPDLGSVASVMLLASSVDLRSDRRTVTEA